MRYSWLIKTVLQDNSNQDIPKTSVYLSKIDALNYVVNIDDAMRFKSKAEAQLILDNIIDKDKFVIEKAYYKRRVN